MQAVIMAGGKGTRLSSLTRDEIPKPMVPILDKPLLLWQVEQLKGYGITEIIMVIGHLGHKIREFFGDGSRFGVAVQYIEENVPLGTAGAFYYLKEKLTEEFFLLIFGDVFFDLDIDRMIAYHHEKAALVTLFVHPNGHPFDSDIVTLDREGRVNGFDSKNNIREYWYDNCVNAGFYVFNRDICGLIDQPVKTDLEHQVLKSMIEQGQPVYGYRSPEYIKDVGTIERIEKTIEDIENGITAKKSLKNKQKCIFLDRDGTLNRLRGFIWREDDFELEQGVLEAVRLINASGYLGIVVTNQPVVARGLCEIEEIRNIHNKMATLLGREGAFLDDILFCPHHPDKGYPEENPLYKIACRCRKPNIGMIEEAADRYHIDLANSWMIGDTTVDIQTGKNAGLKTVMVLTGEAGNDHKYQVKPDLWADNLFEAVKLILNCEKRVE